METCQTNKQTQRNLQEIKSQKKIGVLIKYSFIFEIL